MKGKAVLILAAAVLLTAIAMNTCHTHVQSKYSSTIEAAMTKGNIAFDAIYLRIPRNNRHVVVFYGEKGTLSVGLLTHTVWGYRWIFGTGTEPFRSANQQPPFLANLPTSAYGDPNPLVSLTFGTVHDPDIARLKIRYHNQAWQDATIFSTPDGRGWYGFSAKPVGADPEVIKIYKDGTQVKGWYKNKPASISRSGPEG